MGPGGKMEPLPVGPLCGIEVPPVGPDGLFDPEGVECGGRPPVG